MQKIETEGPQRVYTDAKLVRRSYLEFLGRLISRKWGVFFVKEKQNKLRLILDCRSANHWFKEPSHVALATGERLRRISFEEDDNLFDVAEPRGLRGPLNSVSMEPGQTSCGSKPRLPFWGRCTIFAWGRLRIHLVFYRVGVDSNHYFQTSFFFKIRLCRSVFRWFPAKKDCWKEWGRYLRHIYSTSDSSYVYLKIPYF